MLLIGRQRRILGFTLASLLRRKKKNAALVIVYAFVVSLVGSVLFFTGAVKQEAALVLRDAPEMMVQKLVAGRQALIPVSYAHEIERIRGVQSVAPRLWGTYHDPAGKACYTLMVDDSSRNDTGEITVGSRVTETLAPSKEGAISFRSHDGSCLSLKIKGVLSSGSDLADSDLILISENDFRRLFSIPPGYFTDLALKIKNPKELTTIAGKIINIFPDARPILRDEIQRTYDAVFAWRGGLVVVVLLGAVFAFIILAWDKATGLSVEERKEMGILKAVGWETSDVMLMKFQEGSAISVLSFLIGISLAYAHIFFSSSLLFGAALEGWSTLYPAFKPPISVNASEIATLFFLTVIPYTVATIVPSWQAATIDPDSVMRS